MERFEHTFDAWRYMMQGMAEEFKKISAYTITADFSLPPEPEPVTEDADFEIIDPKQLPAPKPDEHDPPGDCGGISHPS